MIKFPMQLRLIAIWSWFFAAFTMPGICLDDDGNGISDVWEHYFYGRELQVHELSIDEDNDGQTSRAEAMFGTNPRDSRSVAEVVVPRLTQTEAMYRFPSEAGIAYQPQISYNLMAGFSDFGPILHGTGSVMSVAVPTEEYPTMQFRLRSEPNRLNADGDLLDAFEEAMFGSSDARVNSDADDLTDVEEFRLTRLGIVLDPMKEYTIPEVRDGTGDFDQDGFSDATELRSRTDPVSPEDAPVQINVRRFGAKGDGVTDDHVAIAAAIALMNETGGQLYFPPGRYRDSGSHVIKAGSIVGVSSNSTSWEYGGARRFLTISGTYFWNTFYMRHLTLRGPSGGPTVGQAWDDSSEGIYIYPTRPNMIFEDVTFERWGHGALVAHDCTFMIFDGCLWQHNKRGLVGGYKADLWTVRGCFFFANDIGADIGYWDPNGVPPGIDHPVGPTGHHWINVGITQNRIGVVIGGVLVSGVTFDQAYGEYNTQTMFMMGHDPKELWFPRDAERNRIQLKDSEPKPFGTRVIWRNCYSLNNQEFVEIHRFGQYELEKCTGYTNSRALVSMRSQMADYSRLEIRDSVGDVRFTTGTVQLGPRSDFPMEVIVVMGADRNTNLAAGGLVELGRSILNTESYFAGNRFIAPQSGVVRVKGMLRVTPSLVDQEVRMYSVVNGAYSNDNLLDVAISERHNQSFTLQGSILLPVRRGETISLGISSASHVETDAQMTRFEIEYVRGY